MKIGSLFDGSGTAPLAAMLCGIEPVWASEIEPYPIKVTKARFPNMRHLGDITQINGAEIEPVDIICGGSPCQDLSVAGKQAGIHEGERSHLFFEMTRIIKQMREATYGNYPKYVIWENVPGAFSSNNGEDFHEVLRSFAEIAEGHVFIPRPEIRRGKQKRLAWTASGEVVGDGWSIAWRTVDAQYWGVPQRRRRIYLVADFADGRAGEILFERKGVRGDHAESGETRKGTAEDASGSSGRSYGVKCLNPWDYQTKRQYSVDGCFPTLQSGERSGQNQQGVCYALCLDSQNCIANEKTSHTLQCKGDIQHNPCVCIPVASFMGGQGAKAGSIAYSEDISPTIKSVMSGGNTIPDVVYAIDQQGGKGNASFTEDQSPTLCSDSHGTPHAVCFQQNQRDKVRNMGERSGAIAASAGMHNANFLCYALQGNGIDRADTAGCNGCGWRENECYTLNTVDRPAVCYDTMQITSPQNYSTPKDGDPCHPLAAQAHPPLCVYDCRGNGDGQTCANLTGDHENRVTDYSNCAVFDMEAIWVYGENGTASTLKQRDYKDVTDLVVGKRKRRYIVRRLTPLECCRLQGFPDWWTDGVEGSDSAKYKMWGNGMALPNMLHVMRGIASANCDQT